MKLTTILLSLCASCAPVSMAAAQDVGTVDGGTQIVFRAGSKPESEGPEQYFWGGPVVGIKAGDAVWCPPGVKHWHGAAPGSSMTHIALTGVKDGKNVEWLEKVSDEQYGK